jgi:hypothetical protein
MHHLLKLRRKSASITQMLLNQPHRFPLGKRFGVVNAESYTVIW